MKMKLLALAAIAAAMLVLPSRLVSEAQAAVTTIPPSVERADTSVQKVHRRWRRWGGPRFSIYIGPRVRYYRPYYRRSSCSWLRRRAIWTGSHYWWRRYQRCRAYYY